LKAEDGILQEGMAGLFDLGGTCREKAGFIPIRFDTVEAGELNIVDTVRDTKRVNHWRTRDDENGGPRILVGQLLSKQQGATDIAKTRRVVGVEENFRGDGGRTIRELLVLPRAFCILVLRSD
jgi:hypothetical protein